MDLSTPSRRESRSALCGAGLDLIQLGHDHARTRTTLALAMVRPGRFELPACGLGSLSVEVTRADKCGQARTLARSSRILAVRRGQRRTAADRESGTKVAQGQEGFEFAFLEHPRGLRLLHALISRSAAAT